MARWTNLAEHPAPAHVLDPGVSLWRWCRTLPAELTTFCHELLAGPWFDLRVRCEPDEVEAAVDVQLVRIIGDRVDRASLTADVAMLAELLATTASCDLVEVRVEHGPGGTCPVFHQDHHLLRLLCTYIGPGTEWLPEGHVDRTELGLRGRTPDDANRAIATGRPTRAAAGEVLVTKGASFGSGADGFVHRSPPVDLGTRVLVAIDPVGELALGLPPPDAVGLP